MPETTAVSDNVRAEMARSRVTQAQLARSLKISQQALSARLAGRTAWSVTQLLSAADVLGVPVSALLPADSSVAS